MSFFRQFVPLMDKSPYIKHYFFVKYARHFVFVNKGSWVGFEDKKYQTNKKQTNKQTNN